LSEGAVRLLSIRLAIDQHNSKSGHRVIWGDRAGKSRAM